MVVYPQGSHFVAEQPDGSSIRITSWNDLSGNRPVTDAGPHCLDEHVAYPRPPECREFGPCAWTSCYDDLGFLRKLLDELEANFPVDPERVDVVGVSNGGMMALRIGCELSGRFAAVVSVIGQLAPGHACGPQSDTPLLHLYGGEDDTVRYDGTPAGDGYIYTSAADTAASWAAALACGNGPARWESAASNHAGLECSAYTDCRRPQDAVVSCMDADGTHEWPGQFVEGVPATCVTAQQKSSMPGQARCEPVTKPATSLGIELVWSFVSDYRTADPR
jgi:poly(3-hydroxybutyrate) depolymerase